VCGLKKKHKPKQKRQTAVRPEEAAAQDTLPAQPAPRVDTSQLRLRTWKRLLKQQQQAQQPAAPKIAQSFRKPRVEDQERLAREAEREAAYQAARKKKSAAASFASLYGTKGNRQPPVLLNRLCDYSHLRQVKVVLVFDAIGGGSNTVTRITAKGAIDVVYVGDADADTFIMLEVSALKESGTPQVLVATSDSDLRDSIAGAHVVTCAALLREMANAEKEAAERIRASQLMPWQERPGIGASVLSQNPGLYKKLNDMRAGRF
jgi:predicted RNA-binding protein with PIN domain